MPVAVDLPLFAVCVVGVLYALGERQTARMLSRPRDDRARWRSVSFYAGLAAIFAALASPIDSFAAKLFWDHMVQHVLLLTVAAPLIVLAAPWMSIWRPLPLGLRRSLARMVARSRALAPLRILGRLLSRPVPAWIAFNLNLALWHVPAVYDLTLRNRAMHNLEHTTFLLFGVLLWAQVLDSPPLRARLSAAHRVYYITAAAAAGWLLSLVIAFEPTPLYAAYAHLAHRPGGISELADQQIAAGVMLGPGSVSMTIFVFFGLWRWLGQEEKPEPTRARAEPPAVNGRGPGVGVTHGMPSGDGVTESPGAKTCQKPNDLTLLGGQAHGNVVDPHVRSSHSCARSRPSSRGSQPRCCSAAGLRRLRPPIT